MASPTTDIVRTTLAVLLIGALISASLWILRPFLPALIWATMTVIATWPLVLPMEKKLWHRRSLVALLMTSAFLLVFVLPASFAIGTIVQNTNEIVNWLKSFGNLVTPEAPDWLKELPYIGKRLALRWQEIAAITSEELRSLLLPHAGTLLRWLMGQVGNIGSVILDFMLTLAITGVLYVKGETIAATVLRLARRIAGTRGEESVWLAAQAIRAVAMGVVVTSIALAAFSWVGLAVSRVPYAMLLAAAVFMLNLVGLGPVPVLVPATLWLYWKGDNGWAAALLVWTILAVALDRILSAILIKKGANVSLLLILPGVIGGLVAFGFIGIFIGPVVLAVAFTLLTAWAFEDNPEMAGDASSATDMDGQNSFEV